MTRLTKRQFKEWGSEGGNSTLKKHGKIKMKEWGKMGGRPKKKSVDITKGLGNNQK